MPPVKNKKPVTKSKQSVYHASSDSLLVSYVNTKTDNVLLKIKEAALEKQLKIVEKRSANYYWLGVTVGFIACIAVLYPFARGGYGRNPVGFGR